ncbi:MAG: hypothetical protein IKJ36_04760 [Clostridia bacterium]|nr:hypothetical protein [Clostridia bacterium]
MIKKILTTAARTILSCVAIAATLGALYVLSIGLSAAATYVKDIIFKLWTYVSGNWIAVIVIVVLVALGTIVYDGISDSVKSWNRNRKHRKNAGE